MSYTIYIFDLINKNKTRFTNLAMSRKEYIGRYEVYKDGIFQFGTKRRVKNTSPYLDNPLPIVLLSKLLNKDLAFSIVDRGEVEFDKVNYLLKVEEIPDA